MVRHAAHIINVCRVRPDGRTAWQAMKGRRTNSKLLPFAETVLFKIPKTHHRIGSFENRWEIGCWVGVVARSGEQLVATPTGVYKVSTIRRRPPDQRWCPELVKSLVGTPAEPIPGSGERKLTAYAKKRPEKAAGPTTYIPMPDMPDESDIRAAKITQRDVENHGGSERCPGCRAAKIGAKFKAKHTHECRQRFERLLQDDIRGRQRFARAAERRMTGIIKMAMEMQDDIEKQAEAATHARASATAGTSSGSGATDAQRQQSVTAQNDREHKAGIKASLQEQAITTPPAPSKKRGAEEADDAERATRVIPPPRGQKREAEEEGNDEERAGRDKEDKRGTQRTDEVQDDSAREKDRDMSSLQQANRNHPGPVQHKFDKGELE